jgi:hypothetical protein
MIEICLTVLLISLSVWAFGLFKGLLVIFVLTFILLELLGA